jgi:hypothetical protein
MLDREGAAMCRRLVSDQSARECSAIQNNVRRADDVGPRRTPRAMYRAALAAL